MTTSSPRHPQLRNEDRSTVRGATADDLAAPA
jgi:hypothetical protein